MHTRKPKMRYDYDFLIKYCTDNDITLKKDYTDVKVNRDTIIEAKCLSCNEMCIKNFRQFIKTECYCKNHTIENSKKKAKETFMERYGGENPMQNKEIRDKMKANSLKNHGVELPMQNPEIAERSSKNAYKSYDYKFPSGRIERVQGYENHTLDILLNDENISEDDIIVNRTDVPVVWWEDTDGKKHRYFVDCLIKSQKRCIETKSTWTFEKKQHCVFLKQQALKDDGYTSEIWVFDSKGNIVNKLI